MRRSLPSGKTTRRSPARTARSAVSSAPCRPDPASPTKTAPRRRRKLPAMNCRANRSVTTKLSGPRIAAATAAPSR